MANWEDKILILEKVGVVMVTHVVVTGGFNHRGSDGLKFLHDLRAAIKMAPGTKVSLCLVDYPLAIEDEFPEFSFLASGPTRYLHELPKRDFVGRSLRYQSSHFLTCSGEVKAQAFILRLRVDMAIISVDRFASFLRDFASVTSSRGRLWVAAEGTRNPYRVPVPFFFSDLIQFGRKEEVVKFWEGAAEYENIESKLRQARLSPSFTPELERPLAPEQFAYGTFLLGRTPNSTHKTSTFSDLRETIGAFGTKIIVVPLAELGLGMPPNWLPLDWSSRGYVFSTRLDSPPRLPLVRSLVAYAHARLFFCLNPLWWGMGRYPVTRSGGKLSWAAHVREKWGTKVVR